MYVLGCIVTLCKTITIYVLSKDQEHKEADEFWNALDNMNEAVPSLEGKLIACCKSCKD